MDLRHGFFQAWRRVSPTPPSLRTCTPAFAVTPVLRRLASRRGVKQCSSASCSVTIDSISEPTATTEEEPVGFDAVSSQGFCIPDAPCPAVLQTRLSKAHTSAASAALVVQDTPDEKLVATASLDKGMAIWRFYSTHGEDEDFDGSCDESIEVTRLKVPGAPVFSLAKIPEVLPDGTIVRKRPKPPGIYLGTSSKEVLTWMLGSKDVTDKVVLDGHTGWVRSLAVTGKWLFSCGCNYLRLWDTTFRTPKECDSVRLFTGDILSITASDGRVFTAGADGSLRSWTITRAGELQEGPCRERAHEGRSSACVISAGRVFTVSYDGTIKAWSAETLELLAEVKGAHNGDKIFCAAVGSNGVLFTGGDDKLVRAWDPDLNPVGLPLEGHGASVRVLSAGRRALLVSGDADGDVCIWETYPVDLPSASKPSGAPAASDPTTAEGAAALLDSAPMLQADAPAPSAAFEVSAMDAARLQLETIMAAELQSEVVQQEEVKATPAAEPAPAEPQALSVTELGQVPSQDAGAMQQHGQGLEAPGSPVMVVELPQACAPILESPVAEQPGDSRAAAAQAALCSDEVHAPGNVAGSMADSLVPPFEVANGFSNGRVHRELQVEAGAAVVHVNGSGSFAVMAATFSEDSQTAVPAATEVLTEAADGFGPPVRQIEVESVASAVAAACLTQDMEGWSPVCGHIAASTGRAK